MSETSSDPLLCFLAAHADPVAKPLYLPGAVVGDWRIIGFIGRGGSSEVYCAENLRDGSPAAVKVLYRSERSLSDRFTQEIAILTDFPHLSFPRMYAHGEVDGRRYMVLELLEPLPLPHGDSAVAQYLVDLAGGLDWLHHCGYVHRDLKPRNVLRRDDGTSVLIDFGLVKKISDSPIAESDRLSVVDGHSVGVGTPGYAAPEQFAGGDATPATDIHALGMIAYRCFDGNPPRIWSRIIRRATSSIPGERYPDVRSFVSAIRRRHLPLVFILVLLACCPLLFLTISEMNVSPRSDADGVKDELPFSLNLQGRSVVKHDPVRLQSGKTYRVIGPGTLDANIGSTAETTLWLTNCVLINRSEFVYPINGVKYVLAGDVYLNFACQTGMTVDVGRYISTPDGAIRDLNRTTMNLNNNDIRFSGPESVEDLKSLKNFECFNRPHDH